MDLLITEMENLLASGKEDYAIQDIIGNNKLYFNK